MDKSNDKSDGKLKDTLKKLPRVLLRGVSICAIRESQCVQMIIDTLGEGEGGAVVTPNLDHLFRCSKDQAFGALVAKSELVVADGMPLIWASRLQGTPLPERVAGSNLISSLSKAAAEHGHSIFLLGGDPGSAEAAAKVLQKRYPKLKVSGTFCPAFGFEKDPKQMQEIIDVLEEAGSGVVFVGLGSPKQEKLVDELRDRLPGRWWLGVGISFSFLAGDVKRAPKWMQRTGLEWVHRLMQEPGRLAKRYLVHGIPFAVVLLGGALLGRFRGNH